MPKSVRELALANIDAQIADLTRAKEIIIMATTGVAEVPEPKKRGRKPKRGLPDTPSNGD